jgi:hypothetical protein
MDTTDGLQWTQHNWQGDPTNGFEWAQHSSQSILPMASNGPRLPVLQVEHLANDIQWAQQGYYQ